MDLLNQTSESLAGRVAHLELQALGVNEVPAEDLNKLWLRGGFPESFLAKDDGTSDDWRLDFIQTYLERDIPQLGPRIPSETLRRFWTMLAHNQGHLFNASALARGLELKSVTTTRYLDLMVDLLLVRRLQPWTSNLGRRLVKSPKAIIRDSGLCHTLLGITTTNDLLGHPVVGGSWECFVIENIIKASRRKLAMGYYRTTGGAEIDLILETRPGKIWAIEIKRSSAPTLSKGFHSACEDIRPARRLVAHGGTDDFPLSKNTEAVSLRSLIEQVGSA